MEQKITTTLKWRFSSVPTVLEFLSSYVTHEFFKDHKEASLIATISRCLAHLLAHHIQFCDQDSSTAAAACLYTALNII